MVEVFGMKVDLELVVKNLRDVKKQVQSSLGGAAGGGGGGSLLGAGIAGGIAGAAASLIAQIPGKLLTFMKEASPALKGTFDMLKRSFMFMFKPFGDMLAIALRPMALAVLKLSVKWLNLFPKIQKFFSPDLTKPIPSDISAALGGRGEVVQGLTDKAAQTLIDALVAGSQEFTKLPQDMKNRFIGWLLQNKEAITQLPNDIRNKMLDWISENKVVFMQFAKDVNDLFQASILDPVEVVGTDFTEKMDLTFKDIITEIGNIGRRFAADFKVNLGLSLPNQPNFSTVTGEEIYVEPFGDNPP